MIKGYSVTAYNEPCEVYACRVSKKPFNRVFRGTQRSEEQTEDAYFVNLEYGGQTDVFIDVDCDGITDVCIKPKQFNIKYEICGKRIVLKLEKPVNFTVEVNGIHNMLHFFATDMKPYEKRDNDIYFGPGVHNAGVIFPKSNQHVYIHPKAYVYGAVLVYKADNVRIYGGGIIDSSKFVRGQVADVNKESGAMAKIGFECGFTQDDVNHSGAFVAYGCKNLTVEDIILTDSMFWTFTTRNGCENVVVDNIKIVGQWRYNSDGFDICASKNVTVKNCFVRSFDDSIVVRGAFLDGEYEDSENILIENNVTWCDWGNNLEMWQGDIPNTIRNVVWRNNYLIKMCMIGISIQTWFGSGKTRIEKIFYENIYADNTGETLIPVYQKEDNESYDIKGQENFKPVIFTLNEKMIGKRGQYQKNIQVDNFDGFSLEYKDIEFKNIYCDGDLLEADIYSYSGNPQKTLSVENVTIKNARYEKLKINIPVKNLTIEDGD